MIFPEGLLSIPLEPFIRLKDWWDGTEKRKGIKEQLLNTLDIEVKSYSEKFEELNRIGKEEVLPFIDSIEV